MVFRSSVFFVLIGLFDSSSHAVASDLDHPRIPGFERFYAVPPSKPVDDDEEPVQLDPVTGGRILLGELNCTSCHSVEGNSKTRLAVRQAPVLDDVGSRVKIDWLRQYLFDPRAVKPGTTMPNLITTLPESDRGTAVEALTHFLASTGTLTNGRPDAVSASKGEVLFRTVGCLACHNSLDDNSPIFATSVLLPDLGKKYTNASLLAFLKDPLKSRPSGRMPAMGLKDEEYRNLSHYFVRDGLTNPNVKFALFHGSWSNLPKFSELKPVSEGEAAGFDLSVSDQPNNYGIQFTTFLQIAKPGDYQFWLGSDDGSRLFIDDKQIIDCDGIHPHEMKQGRAILTSGFHKVVVQYFQGGGEASLEVQISGQGLSQQPLASLSFLEPGVPVPDSKSGQPAFTLDPVLVARGRELFGAIGCASCHQLKLNSQVIVSALKTKPLADVITDKGCLADNITGKAPRYGLSDVQRNSLRAATKALPDESPAEMIHRTLATLNCYACHRRDKLGGVEEARNNTFESLQKEMGDEGRLPPVLTGVGDKLKTDWMRQILNNGASDRGNYMKTKMPKFGSKNVEPLVGLFESVDLRPETMPKAVFSDPDYRVKGAGRHLVGGQALSCIKCHDFGPYPSTGIRAINLTTMTQRLRADWFYRYVLDPQAYRRGTRMPAPWPFGQTTIRDTLNADVNLQIQAVWLYLSDRDKAAVPVGLVREPIELKPQTEPIIYRNFIEGAGTRAIGVGYPEGVNLAFDANNMRLALIWHGAFIDASRHWTGRGQGFEPPLGDDVVPLPNQVPFLVLDKPDREFPTEMGREIGYKFLGYHLDSEKRPIFRYSTSGLTIEDHPFPVKASGSSAMLKRTLHFQGPQNVNQLWYRAATAEKLEESGEHRYRIDGIWTMEVEVSGPDKPMIRDSSGKKELLIPIRIQNGHAEISQLYVW